MEEKNKINKEYGLSFLTLSNKYLHLVKNVLKENIKQGNHHCIYREITEREYDEATKWSDFHISMPVLFDFYQGLELLLKGFLFFHNEFRSTHNFKKLLDYFKNYYCEEKEIILILEKYLTVSLMPSLLSECLKNNNISINELYEFFRYPTDKRAQNLYSYISLKYKGEDGLNFFKELVDDLSILIRKSVKLYKKIELQ